ncbi:MAG: hypothetical protein OHK0053_04890 [Microscillaceae bacterium]
MRHKLLLSLICWAWLGLHLGWAFDPPHPEPTYGTATVDGDFSEWDLSSDFFANMYRAGKDDKPVESKLYLRYDCATGKLYVLVLSANGTNILADASHNDDHFVKLGNSNKLIDASDEGNGFEWIGLTNDDRAQGWEAVVTLAEGDYPDLNVHTQVFSDGESQTSAVDERAIPISILCEEEVILVENLILTAFCSYNPDVYRYWRVRNPNAFSVEVRWEVVGTNPLQTGTYEAPAGDSFFCTQTVGGPNTTKIFWLDQNGVERSTVKASNNNNCITPIAFEALCYDDASTRRFRVANPNNKQVTIRWNDGTQDIDIVLAANSSEVYTFATTTASIDFSILPNDDCGTPLVISQNTLNQACPRPVRPVLECVKLNNDGSYAAVFGYLNENAGTVEIAVGENNNLTPNTQNALLPTTFLPGRQVAAFEIPFDGSNLVWTLEGPDGSRRTSTASANSAACPRPVRPVLECVKLNNDGSYAAVFGYLNENAGTVEIAVGENNNLTPNTQNAFLPTTFLPGRQVAAFEIPFDGSNLVWTLEGPDGSRRTSTASANSAACFVIADLNLTSECSYEEDERRWRVTNPNDFAVEVTYVVYGTSQTGTFMATPGLSYFFTQNTGGANTTIIKWRNEKNELRQKTKASNNQICDICEKENVVEADLFKLRNALGANDGNHSIWLNGFLCDHQATRFTFDDTHVGYIYVVDAPGNPRDGWLHLIGEAVVSDGGECNGLNYNQTEWDVDIWFRPAADGETVEPKFELNGQSSADWRYWVLDAGKLTHKADVNEYVILQKMPNNYGLQVGTGANGKNLNFGASTWFHYTVKLNEREVSSAAIGKHGDINIDLVPACEVPPVICDEFTVSFEASNAVTDEYAYTPRNHSLVLHDFYGAGQNAALTFEAGARLTFKLDESEALITGVAFFQEGAFANTRWEVSAPYGPKNALTEPKEELRPQAYIANGGPVDSDTWKLFIMTEGATLRELDADNNYTGRVISLSHMPETGQFGLQIGEGANGKNIQLGASAWFFWYFENHTSSGDFNISLNPICYERPASCAILKANHESDVNTSLSVYDASTNTLLAPFYHFAKSGYHIAVNQGGQRLYAVNENDGTMGYLELSSGLFYEVVGDASAQKLPLGLVQMVYLPAENALLAASKNSDKLFKISLDGSFTELGKIENTQTNDYLDIRGADIALNSQGMLYLMAKRPNNNKSGLYRLNLMPSPHATFIGGSYDNPTGLAFLDNGTGNLLVSFRGQGFREVNLNDGSQMAFYAHQELGWGDMTACVALDCHIQVNLVNARTNEVLCTIENGATIDLNALQLDEFNVVVTEVATGTKSVIFNLSGPVNHVQTENMLPLALFGDDTKGDFYGRVARLGQYTLNLKAFEGIRGTGHLICEDQVQFTFVRRVETAPLVIALLDADDDQILDAEMEAGETYDVNGLEFANFTAHLTTYPVGTKSVAFILSGPVSVDRTENMAPFALFGDDVNTGDFYGQMAKLGDYTLTVKAYSEKNRMGNLLGEKTIPFGFVANPANATLKFSLVDADTDEIILTDIPSGAQIDVNSFDQTLENFNIIASTYPYGTESAEFSLSGPIDALRTENLAPYALFGDIVNTGDYNGHAVIIGTYNFTVTAYSQDNKLGTQLASRNITFSFVNNMMARTAAVNPVQGTGENLEIVVPVLAKPATLQGSLIYGGMSQSFTIVVPAQTDRIQIPVPASIPSGKMYFLRYQYDNEVVQIRRMLK